MKKSYVHMHKDIEMMKSEVFVEKCKIIKKSHFTRKRKMPLYNLLLSILFRKGRTLYMELKEFKKKFGMKVSISKAGYLKQRFKLNPQVFKTLAIYHAKQFYLDRESVKLWKGHLILAVDGTSLNVPLTRKNVDTYGNASKHGQKERPQIGLSCLYDVINRMIIDMNIGNCKLNERKEAIGHINKVKEVIEENKSIFLFDRGYPSGEFFLDLMERNTQFLIRLGSSSFKKEQKTMTSNDCIVNIIFDKTRCSACKKESSSKRLKEAGGITLRFVHIKLSDNNSEYLATNLPIDEFNTEEIFQMYHMRWGIETAFDDLKNKLQIENFTGETPIIMEQDIYATIYLSNIMNDIIQDASAVLVSTNHYQYKHEMQINKAIAIGTMKEELFNLILEPNVIKKEKLMDFIIDEINKNLLPVRKNRIFERSSGKLASKYSNNRKRCF